MLDAPDGGAAVVAEVTIGQVLEVLDRQDGWLLLRPPGAARRWEAGWLVEDVVAAIGGGALARRASSQGPIARPPRAADPTTRKRPAAWVSSGYLFFRDFDSNFTFPVGLYADVSANVINEPSRALSIVGEFGWSRKSERLVGVDVDLTQRTYMGGVRIAGAGGAGPYVQALGGILSVSARAPRAAFGVTDSQGALQFGGGVMTRLGNSTAIRLGGDYRWSPGATQIQMVVGFAFGLGGR